jgi:hypothetical protein
MRSLIICTFVRYWYSQIKKEKMCGVCSLHGEKISVYKILVRKPKGKRTLPTLRCSWKDSIEKYLKNMGWIMCTEFICLTVGASGKLL